MKTAFLYHRYSTDNQKEGYTLEYQRRITKELAGKHNCRIINTYEDKGISGSSIDKRPSMIQLIEDLKEIKPDYIICVDQDRVARGNDFWYIKSLMSQSDTSFITEKEGLIDFNDITKDALSDMMGVFAKLERGMISRRIKRAMDQRAEKGLALGNLKRIYGYDFKDGKLVINKYEAVVINKIFKLYLQGKGFWYIARYLNLAGYKPKKANLFSKQAVRNILRNPIYCGYLRHKGKIYKGKHGPIIPESTYKLAQQQYSSVIQYNKGRKTKYLLTGFLYCYNCGSKLYSSKASDGGRNYSCSGYRQDLCKGQISIKMNRIDDFVMNLITKKIKDKNLNIKLDQETRDFSSEIDIENQRRSLENKMERLVDEYTDGFVPQELYRKKLVKLQKGLDSLKTNKTSHSPHEIIKSLKGPEIFLDASLEDKRKVIQFFINKIIVKKGYTHDVGKRIKIEWNEINKN